MELKYIIKKILKESHEEFNWVNDIPKISEAEYFLNNLFKDIKIEVVDDYDSDYYLGSPRRILDDDITIIKSKKGDILLIIQPPYTNEYHIRVGSPNQINHKRPNLIVNTVTILKPLENMGIEWNKGYHQSSTYYIGGEKLPKGRSNKYYKEKHGIYGIDILKDVVRRYLNFNIDNFSVVLRTV